MENIKYSDIQNIGVEIFKKNNSSFLKSDFSRIMERIFKAANKPHIKELQGEGYMKSAAIPNRVFYIYSDQLLEKYPDKFLDVVVLNNKLCVWIYSKNFMNNIEKNPVDIISILYNELICMFTENYKIKRFVSKEYIILRIVMTMNLIIFLNETYNILDVEVCKKVLINELTSIGHRYTKESAKAFIDDICDNYSNISYIDNREYLDSYLLLEENVELTNELNDVLSFGNMSADTKSEQ